MSTFQGLKVVSAARKVIFQVPASDKVAAFPVEATISPYGQNNERPSIVVQNRTDGGSYQGADSENGVVIFNEVPGDFSEQLLAMYDGTIDGLQRICEFAAQSGYGDQYTTSKDFVRTKLSPAGTMVSEFTGVVKRDDRDVCTVYRDGDGILQIVVPKGTPKRIESDIVVRTYRKVDGGKINVDEIPVIS